MSYLVPSEFVTKMVDAGESKIFMSTRDTLIRAYMAGAILAMAAVFAITVGVQTGSTLIGAILFPVGLFPGFVHMKTLHPRVSPFLHVLLPWHSCWYCLPALKL